MSPKQDKGPTYAEIIRSLLEKSDTPIQTQELIERTLSLRPSSAKNPTQAVKTQLRQEVGHLLVFLDKDTILPTRVAMKGVCFRIKLEREMIQTGLFEVGNILKTYLPRHFSVEKAIFVDKNGKPIEFQLKNVRKKRNDLIFGAYEATNTYADIGNWLRKQKAIRKDYLIFTLEDWEHGIFQIEHERYAKSNQKLLTNRNQMLADLFYEMLENSTQEQLYLHESIPTVYARLPEKNSYPPDHWIIVLENDGRMVANSWTIQYRDGRLSPTQKLTRELAGEARDIELVSFSKEQGNQAYRIKAELKHNPKIWREVEILGKQTLADLKSILVNAFKHDFDHLGGFWKIVPRKTSLGKVRYREVDLGNVDPFNGGDGAEIKIASIGLSEGGRLKFVFDFGDWIEHNLTLESIAPSQPGGEYPRETGRNKPNYLNCVSCEEKAGNTTAHLICLTCSDTYQKKMVYCEQCSQAHEDHHLEEILY